MTLKGKHRRLIVSIAVVFLIAVSLRGWSLNSDPSPELSRSLAPFTDGPAAISPARQAMLEDQGYIGHSTHPDSNPFVAGMIWPFLRIAGFGLWQGRLLFVLAGCLSCVVMMLILQRDQLLLTPLFAGLFLATNYVFVQYNRLALEENLVNLLGLISFACLRTLSLRLSFISGLLAGVTVFLIKLHGLIYVAAMAGALLVCWVSLSQTKPRLVKVVLAWLAGFALLFVLSTLFHIKPAYSPLGQYFIDTNPGASALSPASAYLVRTHTRTLSIGIKTGLFHRMPVVCLLAAAFLLSLITRAEHRAKCFSGEREQTFIPSELILVCMVTASFAGLSILEYRPLRYETLLIPSLTGLAAVLLGQWLTPSEQRAQSDTEQVKTFGSSNSFSIICLRGLRAVVLFYLTHLVLWSLKKLVLGEQSAESPDTSPALIIFAVLLWLPLLQFWQPLYMAVSNQMKKRRLAWGVAIVSLSILMINQIQQSVVYFKNASGNTISASRNVAPLFPAGFMITGEFADAICVETQYASHPYSSRKPTISEALEQSPSTGALLVRAIEKDGKWTFFFRDVADEIRNGNWMPILAQSLGPVTEKTRIVQVLIARTGVGHFRQAMACLLSGDELSALHHFRQFLENNPNHIPALLYVAALDSRWKEIPPVDTDAFRRAEKAILSGIQINDWDRHHFEALKRSELELLQLVEGMAFNSL